MYDSGFGICSSFSLALFKVVPLTVSWQGRLHARAGDYAVAADVFQKVLELWYALQISVLMNVSICFYSY